MPTFIHPMAYVESGAELDEDVYVGPFCLVGQKVKLGKGTRLDSHVNIAGRTTIGPGCRISPYASIGTEPQDLKYKGEDTGVEIGSENTLREYVTVHRGSVGGDGVTRIGNGNYLMAYVHIAHDCQVANNTIMASFVAMGGHVQVFDHAFIGGMTGLHQFVRVGEQSMIGGFSRIVNDVPPFVLANGADDACLFGLNKVGLKRRGFSDETIDELNKAYKILFKSGLTLKNAVKKVQEDLPFTDEISRLVEFLQGSGKRGYLKSKRRGGSD